MSKLMFVCSLCDASRRESAVFVRSVCIYSQNRVLRSTVGFFGAIDGFGLGDGDGTDVGDGGNCGKPAAAIMVVMRCCCIMNIIIEAAIGLKRAGLGPGKTLLKSGMGDGVAILL